MLVVDIKESKWMAVMNRKIFFMVGLGLGLISFALTAMSGLEVERSSLLQLYNFNDSVNRACIAVWKVLSRNNGDGEIHPELQRFLREREIDDETGAGWTVPMVCFRPAESVWEINEASHRVFLFKWKGRPFGVLAIELSIVPKVRIARFRCGTGAPPSDSTALGRQQRCL